jgi:formylglycine-generating enzyme required for sulfatase activity
MLFDEQVAARIGELWTTVSEAGGARGNLWDESWDDPLAEFTACYDAAVKAQSPECWRAVVIQGRALRAALENHDGTEHRLYIATTRVTDAVDGALDVLARDGRGLLTPEMLDRLIGKVENLEKAVAEDRASRKVYEVEAKRTLDAVAAKVESAKAPLIDLKGATVNPNFSLISSGLAEAAELLSTVLKFIQDRNLADRIKRAAEKVKEAGGEFFREVRRRFTALKLPWKKTATEDYLTGGERPNALPFLVRDGDKDREERRVAGGGIAFQDCWLEQGKKVYGPEMVVVPSGRFLMGSPEDEVGRFDHEGPQHEVTIPRAFAIGRCAVTRGQFAAFVAATRYYAGSVSRSWRDPGFSQDDSHPAVGASWDDATTYVKWLSGKTGKDYRLPLEAEWEFTCRAGTKTPFWWGSSITPDQANYDGSAEPYKYRKATVPAKHFEANPWGLYQVHGNVWEWCGDCWNDSYKGAPTDGLAWTTGDCNLRVLRGGSGL